MMNEKYSCRCFFNEFQSAESHKNQLRQDHIDDSPAEYAEHGIVFPQLQDDDERHSYDFFERIRILGKRHFAKAVYENSAYYGRRKILAEIQNDLRRLFFARAKQQKRESPRRKRYGGDYDYRNNELICWYHCSQSSFSELS